MLADPATTRAMAAAARSGRGPGAHLRDSLTRLAGCGEVLRHAERPWASITFSGARHTVALLFAGREAVAQGERFIAELPDHEFAIPGQLVADAAVISAVHEMLPEPKLTVEAELLLLEES